LTIHVPATLSRRSGTKAGFADHWLDRVGQIFATVPNTGTKLPARFNWTSDTIPRTEHFYEPLTARDAWFEAQGGSRSPLRGTPSPGNDWQSKFDKVAAERRSAAHATSVVDVSAT